MSDNAWKTHELTAGDDPSTLLEREWLLTNGTGGYAMSTALGAPTRRYHGLLIASQQPPVARCVIVNQMWERLEVQSSKFKVQSSKQSPDRQIARSPNSQDFSTLLFRNERGQQVFAPRGHELLQRFERSGTFIRWAYRWGDITFERELMLHWHEQAITLRYRVERGQGAEGEEVESSKFKVQSSDIRHQTSDIRHCILRLSPMVTLRDFHGLLGIPPEGPSGLSASAEGEILRMAHGDLRAVFHCAGGRFKADEQWWYNVHYPCEAERGQEDHEDYFVPGGFEIALNLATPQEVVLTAALGDTPVKPCPLPHPRAGHLAEVGVEGPRGQGAKGEEDKETRRQGEEEKVQSPKSKVQSSEPGPSLRSGTGVEGEVQSSDIRHQTSDIRHSLAIAADDFVVRRRFGDRTFSTIIAGYPWFADWGRDTFIALPGLLLTTGRHDEARSVLELFSQNLRNGLVPNRFDDYQPTAAHYNTVDGSLWFIHAALRYLKASSDRDSWRQWLSAACVEIVEAYQHGTDYDIHMDGDGLIAAGSPMTQLTWMDAAVGTEGDPNRIVFTPRPGKAVEINALWYAALMGLAETLEAKQQKYVEGYRALAEKVRQSFGRVFWRDEVGYLLDYLYVDDAKRVHADAKLRPNQLFALSLPHSPISQARQKRVLRAVRDALLTPMGLRTLAADDPDYHGRYTGDQFHRDAAYHQGTVWPWLIGPYAEAVLRVGEFSDKARQEARAALAPLVGRITDEPTDPPAGAGGLSLPGSIGQLHEIYEGDEPHRAVGCIAQAWSVAELLRVRELLVTSD